MGFFDDAWKALDGLGQEAGKHVGPALGEAWERMDAFGQEAGKHVGPAVGEAWKHAKSFTHSPKKYRNPGPNALAQAPHEHFDWTFLEQFGEKMAKQVGSTADDFWQNMNGGDFVQDIGKLVLPKIEFNDKDLGGFSERLKQWILQHPKEFATLLACVASGPITAIYTSTMLGLAGFTPIGIGAGTLASSIQSGLGPVAADSAFAVLTSAGMGGYGVAIVQAFTLVPTVTGVCGVAAASFLSAIKEDAKCNKETQE